MTKNILLLLATAAALSFTACSGDEETRYPAEAKSEKVAWKVDVRSQPTPPTRKTKSTT